MCRFHASASFHPGFNHGERAWRPRNHFDDDGVEKLGATYLIPTLIVPLLLITHGLAFRILLQHQKEFATQPNPHLA